MPATRKDLLHYLDVLQIPHQTLDHKPTFTVEESAEVKSNMPGGHTKNLFLKDKAGTLFLLCAEAEATVRVNKLHPVLGCKRLSFGKPDLLLEYLGVTPGSVTLFSILNDKTATVTLIIDEALIRHDIVNFHPLRNDATTAISSIDMIKFAEATGHSPIVLDLAKLNEETSQ